MKFQDPEYTEIFFYGLLIGGLFQRVWNDFFPELQTVTPMTYVQLLCIPLGFWLALRAVKRHKQRGLPQQTDNEQSV